MYIKIQKTVEGLGEKDLVFDYISQESVYELLWFSLLFFFGGFSSTGEFFTLMETSSLLVRGCKFWPMFGSKAIEQWGFFSVPIHCDTGHPFTMVISDDPRHSNQCRECHYLFNESILSRLGFEHSTFRMRRYTFVTSIFWRKMLSTSDVNYWRKNSAYKLILW